VHRIQRRLVAGVGVDRGHHAFFDADGIVEDLGDRRQAVGGAGRIGDDQIILAVSTSWLTP
jgi:hypothetical protein